MQQTDAKYKVYLDESVYIVFSQFFAEMLKIFQDPSVAMMSVVGACTLPLSGLWWESYQCYGTYYTVGNDDFLENSGLVIDGQWENVCTLDGRILITQYDLPWREAFIGNYFFAQAQCREFLFAGYKLAVPCQTKPWCVYSTAFVLDGHYEEEYRQYLEQYEQYLLFPHEIDHIVSMLYYFGQQAEVREGYRFFCPEGIAIGDDTSIQKDAWFQLPYNNYCGYPRIAIGKRCDIGYRCTISAVHRIVLEDDVLVASNVHITDHNHVYEQIGTPIKEQGVYPMDGEVIIGCGSWFANNVVIAGNVHIGKGCVIAAGSVVTQDVADYCVAAGTPARVVKAYDPSKKKWIRIKDQQAYDVLLQRRRCARVKEF